MSTACSLSTRKVYGLQRVCQVWGIHRSTVYAQRQRTARSLPPPTGLSARRGPKGPCGEEDLVGHIRQLLSESPFHGEGHRKVWAQLRWRGVRTSKARVRRLMREGDLQAPGRTGHPHGPKAHDGVIITVLPEVMWGTDGTTTMTRQEGQAFVFVRVDHCNFECVGLHASASANRFEALEPRRQGVRQHFGGYHQQIAVGLAGRYDHGSAYMGDDFQQERDFLGIQSSPSFVREPQGNGCAERFIRLLKENRLWVRTCDPIEELRQALLAFKDLYNSQWILERHGYRTPSQVPHDLRESRIAEAAG